MADNNAEPRAAAKSKTDTIDRTSTTVAQIECALKESLHTDATLESWDYVEMGKGKGFLSCMIRMELEWSSDDAKLPKSVAIKIPDLTNIKAAFGAGGDQMKKLVDIISDNLMMIHNNELVMYKLFGAMPQCDVPVPMARCLGLKEISDNANPDGYLILEDLSKETACVDVSQGYSYAQTKKLVDMLARLHAWGLNNEAVWKTAGLMDDLEKMMGPMLDGMMQTFDGFAAWIREPEQADFFGDTCVGRIEELRPDLKLIGRYSTMHKDFGLPDILVHGDFWSNNILMHCDADTMLPTDEIRAIIDWQMAHPGSPGEDLARLLLMSCDNDMRMEHTDELLRFYHGQLVRHLGGTPAPFSLPQLADFYERMFVAYAGMFVPFFRQAIAMIDTGHFIKTTDPGKMKNKMMNDFRSTMLEAFRLIDKHKEE